MYRAGYGATAPRAQKQYFYFHDVILEVKSMEPAGETLMSSGPHNVEVQVEAG